MTTTPGVRPYMPWSKKKKKMEVAPKLPGVDLDSFLSRVHHSRRKLRRHRSDPMKRYYHPVTATAYISPHPHIYIYTPHHQEPYPPTQPHPSVPHHEDRLRYPPTTIWKWITGMNLDASPTLTPTVHCVEPMRPREPRQPRRLLSAFTQPLPS